MTARMFLLVYSEAAGTRQEVKAIVSAYPEKVTWRYDMPNSIYIVARGTLEQLTQYLNGKFGGESFLLVELEWKRIDGILTDETWAFMINHLMHSS